MQSRIILVVVLLAIVQGCAPNYITVPAMRTYTGPNISVEESDLTDARTDNDERTFFPPESFSLLAARFLKNYATVRNHSSQHTPYSLALTIDTCRYDRDLSALSFIVPGLFGAASAVAINSVSSESTAATSVGIPLGVTVLSFLYYWAAGAFISHEYTVAVTYALRDGKGEILQSGNERFAYSEIYNETSQYQSPNSGGYLVTTEWLDDEEIAREQLSRCVLVVMDRILSRLALPAPQTGR